MRELGAAVGSALASVALVVAACGGGRAAGSGETLHGRPVEPGWGLVMRMSRAAEPLVDATFDQEARGARPGWVVERWQLRATERMLLAARSDVAACFASAARGAVGAIDVPVRFDVSFGGTATAIIVESAAPRARACLTARLRRVRFPEPRPGHRFSVRYVLRF